MAVDRLTDRRPRGAPAQAHASQSLIEAYLAELRRELGRRHDADDIVAEVADHLCEVADWHADRGMDHLTAERHALGQFGTSTIVARAFAQHGKGIAMPTSFTRRSGLLWLLSAMLLASGFVLIMHESWRGAWDATVYAYGAILIGAGIAALLGGMVGVWRRHGGSLGRVGLTGLVLTGVAVLPGTFLTWFTPIWMTLLALGCVAFAVAVARAGVVSPVASGVMAAGIIIVTGAMWAGGPLETFSDRYLWAAPGWAGGLAFVAGCAWLGYQLWMESPAEAPAGLVTP